VTFNLLPPDGDFTTLYDILGFDRNKAFVGSSPDCVNSYDCEWVNPRYRAKPLLGGYEKSTVFSYSVAGNHFEMRIQDQLLQPISPGGYFTARGSRILIFDISGFKGQVVKLSLKETGDIDPGRGGTAGFAYLDSVQIVTELPRLQISPLETQLVLSWPASATDFVLQSRDSFSPQTPWQVVTQAPVVVGDQKTLTIDNQGQAKLFRLSLGGY
jgi:hypothetical protein